MFSASPPQRSTFRPGQCDFETQLVRRAPASASPPPYYGGYGLGGYGYPGYGFGGYPYGGYGLGGPSFMGLG